MLVPGVAETCTQVAPVGAALRRIMGWLGGRGPIPAHTDYKVREYECVKWVADKLHDHDIHTRNGFILGVIANLLVTKLNILIGDAPNIFVGNT